MRLSHRKMYTFPWSPEEIRINNYNPLLLMLWKANMDLQFVGESTLVIANYVTGYVTKAERSNMQDLWQECPHTLPYIANCGPLVSAACAPGSVVSMRPVISS